MHNTFKDVGCAHESLRAEEVSISIESSELAMLERLISMVRVLDPDILVGYEIQNSSWGYLIERARLKYGRESYS